MSLKSILLLLSGFHREVRTDVISARSDFGAVYTQKHSHFRDNGNATTVKKQLRTIENWVRRNYVGPLKPRALSASRP